MSGKCRVFMFAKQFAGLVESGKKRTTIRMEENPRAEVGDVMRGINGQWKELLRAEIKGVHPFSMYRKEVGAPLLMKRHGALGPVLSSDDSQDSAVMGTLACQDGFDGLSDLVRFFNGGDSDGPCDLRGWLYRW